ncbi:hypothetical protein CRUP_028704 [Coryphaenoides rupestris]|nr:hypothetical protein CRUP_028704 [Coryphaenoides rupestris]
MGLDEDNEPDNEGCNLSCLVAIGRLHPHILPQPVTPDIHVKPTEYVSRHAIDGKFVFVDQRMTSDTWQSATDKMREKINTNCYKFKIKDGSFITLRSRWFSFMNPWTKEVEYIVSTNTVVSCPMMEGSDYPQSAASPQSMDSVLTSEGGGRRALQTVPGIPGGTRAGAGKIGRMIAEEVMEIQRIRGSSPSSCGSSPLNITSTPPPDTCSPGGKKHRHHGRAGLQQPSNDEAAMAVIMSLLEADAGLGGPVDFSDLPWPL